MLTFMLWAEDAAHGQAGETEDGSTSVESNSRAYILVIAL